MIRTLKGGYVNPTYIESFFLLRDATRKIGNKLVKGCYVKCKTVSGDEISLFFGTEEQAQQKIREYAEEVKRAGVAELLCSIRDEIAGLTEVTDPAFSRPRVNPYA